MRLILTCVLFLSTNSLYSQETTELRWQQQSSFAINQVSLVEQKIIEESNVNFINSVLKLTFEVKTLAHSCVKSFHLDVVNAQTSLSDPLNPTDLYMRLVAKQKDCGATAGFGRERVIRYTQSFDVAQRRVGTPAVPIKLDFGKTYHLNYDIGMLGGFNRWGMWKLDLSDVYNVKFEHVKNYTYVEGTIQEVSNED